MGKTLNRELPKEIIDSEGNIVQTFTDIELVDLKAQLALEEIQNLGNEFNQISSSLNSNNIDIAQIINDTEILKLA